MAKKSSTKVLREFAAKKTVAEETGMADTPMRKAGKTATKASKAKGSTSKAEPKAKKPSGGPTVERDAWGCKAGSQAAVINAALGTKPQKPAALAESTGLDGGRIRAHLKHLLGKGLVVETDAGFATKKGK